MITLAKTLMEIWMNVWTKISQEWSLNLSLLPISSSWFCIHPTPHMESSLLSSCLSSCDGTVCWRSTGEQCWGSISRGIQHWRSHTWCSRSYPGCNRQGWKLHWAPSFGWLGPRLQKWIVVTLITWFVVNHTKRTLDLFCLHDHDGETFQKLRKLFASFYHHHNDKAAQLQILWHLKQCFYKEFTQLKTSFGMIKGWDFKRLENQIITNMTQDKQEFSLKMTLCLSKSLISPTKCCSLTMQGQDQGNQGPKGSCEQAVSGPK